MHYTRSARRTVSRQFRELVQEELPGLGNNETYWRLFEWHIFGSRLKETGGVLASREILAEIEGKTAQLRNNRYTGLPFLESYRRDVAPIEWSNYSVVDGKARVITNNALSERVLNAAQTELATPVKELYERVYLVSGAAYTVKRQQAARREDQEAANTSAQARLVKADGREVRTLVEYLNTLPPARYTKMLSRLPEAYEVASTITKEERRERAYKGLRAFADQPQQFYAPSSARRSVRVFGFQGGLVSLPREVRKALLQDFTSVDLASAQLAVVAQLWDVPSVQQFLLEHRDRGRSIWPSLCAELELPYNEHSKQGIKPLVYALCFGGGARRKNDAINKKAREEFGDDGEAIVKRFMALPMIADLYEARLREAKRVENDKGSYDCFGNWIPLEYGYGKAASVLACQAQAVELKLLWPVVERAVSSDDVGIVCWLFDGCSLAFKDASKKERILRQLQAAVRAQADELGVITSLEIEKKEVAFGRTNTSVFPLRADLFNQRIRIAA